MFKTWNSLVWALKTEPSHLQGSEPCPRDQPDEMCKLKWKTFVYCNSLSRKGSLTMELNTEECINIQALATEECNSIFSVSTKCLSFSLFVGSTFPVCKLGWLLCWSSSHHAAKCLVSLSTEVCMHTVFSSSRHVQSPIKHDIILQWQTGETAQDGTNDAVILSYWLFTGVSCR